MSEVHIKCSAGRSIKNRDVLSISVDEFKWIVSGVDVLIKRVAGIYEATRCEINDIWRKPPAYWARVVSCPEVVEAGFGVAFFAVNL